MILVTTDDDDFFPHPDGESFFHSVTSSRHVSQHHQNCNETTTTTLNLDINITSLVRDVTSVDAKYSNCIKAPTFLQSFLSSKKKIEDIELRK